MIEHKKYQSLNLKLSASPSITQWAHALCELCVGFSVAYHVILVKCPDFVPAFFPFLTSLYVFISFTFLFTNHYLKKKSLNFHNNDKPCSLRDDVRK